MDIRGKLALVTGGSDGIGREIALQLKDAGAQVIVTGRSAEKLAAMAAQGFGTIAGDLSEQQGIDAVVDGIAGKPLALLINNAGIGGSYLLDDPATLADANLCLRTNVEAPIALCTRLLPALRAQPEAMIVNVTSGLAIAPAASGSVYSASKAALRAYTQALRYLLRDSGVHVAEALPPRGRDQYDGDAGRSEDDSDRLRGGNPARHRGQPGRNQHRTGQAAPDREQHLSRLRAADADQILIPPTAGE